MRYLSLAMLAAAGMCASAAAFAQHDPSSDDIINSLRPTRQGLTDTTRGILPALTQPDAAPAASRHRPAVHRVGYGHRESAAPEDGMKALPMDIDFVTGSAALTPHAARQLDTLGHALTAPDLSKFRFRIEGHTDTVGTPEYNKDLSTQRAQAVTAYLEEKCGVEAARLDAVGLGVSELIVPTPDQTPEPRNRRVKIVNLDS